MDPFSCFGERMKTTLWPSIGPSKQNRSSLEEGRIDPANEASASFSVASISWVLILLSHWISSVNDSFFYSSFTTCLFSFSSSRASIYTFWFWICSLKARFDSICFCSLSWDSFHFYWYFCTSASKAVICPSKEAIFSSYRFALSIASVFSVSNHRTSLFLPYSSSSLSLRIACKDSELSFSKFYLVWTSML